MKQQFFLLATVVLMATTACKKSSAKPAHADTPRTNVPATLTGNWMYGNFSMTEYWDQDPADYLGNALEMAFAFTFEQDGSYMQYFTSSSATNGVTTYQQSVTHGTLEVNTATNNIITHPVNAHYKRTANNNVVEERDLPQNELTATTYAYTTGTKTNGTKALYLTLENTTEPLTFLKKE